MVTWCTKHDHPPTASDGAPIDHLGYSVASSSNRGGGGSFDPMLLLLGAA